MSAWPASNDYTIAIQAPRLCFRDRDLQAGALERSARTGMPKVWTGNFAQVYALAGRRGRWAVKCFTRSSADIRTRYARIAAALDEAALPCFTDFQFLNDEMLVGGARFPIVKMRWLDGQPLDAFVEANLQNARALRRLERDMVTLVRDLEARRFAHGDLQHGNIIVTDRGVKLVDYDAMYIPAFAGTAAPEQGLPAYQHPRRSASDYGVGLDRFSLLVIRTALAAVAADPALWREYHNGDNLLFVAEDFRRPQTSAVFSKLTAVNDADVRALAQTLITACARAPLETPLAETASAARSPGQRPWFQTAPSAAPPKKLKARRRGRPRRVRVTVRRSTTARLSRHVPALVASAGALIAMAIAAFVNMSFGVALLATTAIFYVGTRMRVLDRWPFRRGARRKTPTRSAKKARAG